MQSAEEQSTSLWTVAEVAAALGVSDAPISGDSLELHGVSIDSRSCVDGDLFIALAGNPGPRFFTSSVGQRDGHEFVDAAARAGARVAIVSQNTASTLPQLRVADTLDGLWALGRAAQARFTGTAYAVTGSSGKTTFKSFLAAALDVPAAAGSLNNFWGVPLCLARTPRDQPAAVFEIGTNQPGEIQPLAELVAPEIAVLLNVHPAHIGYFSGIDALRQEKLSINSGLEDLSQFVCEYSVALDAGIEERCVSFGDDRNANFRLRSVSGDKASFHTPEGQLVALVPGGGVHRAQTLAAVLAALWIGQRDLASALELDPGLVPVGRGNEQFIRLPNGGHVVLIDDSYNANPASMAAAVAQLSQRSGVRVAVLGEMGELGEASPDYHRQLAQACAELDGVYCVGAGARETFDGLAPSQRLGYADSVDSIDMTAFVAQLPAAATLLVKGSNGVFWQHNWCQSLQRVLQGESS